MFSYGFLFFVEIPFVSPERFERSTHSLEGCCSIQLSYGTIGLRRFPAAMRGRRYEKKIEFRPPLRIRFFGDLFCGAEYFAYICRLYSPKG